MIMNKLFFTLLLTIISISSFGQSCEDSTKVLPNLYPMKENTSRYHNNWTKNYYPKRIQDFKHAPLQTGEIVFIGNSITEGGADWSNKFGIAHIRNRGIAGDVTDGVLKRLDEVTHYKPKAVFILIGINDLFSLHHQEDNPALKYDKVVKSPQYIGKNILKIAKIIHRKSPGTRIYVRTLLPTRRAYMKEDLLAVNKIIRKNEAKGFYTMIDLYSQFVDTQGELISQLTTDGVHLNESGYQKWVKFEKPIIERLF